MPIIVYLTLNQIKMKKTFFAVAFLATLLAQQAFAQESPKTSNQSFLNSYYAIKDALVSSNPGMAAANAAEFVKTLNATNDQTVKKETRAALLNDAEIISQSKDIKLQREKFISLSDNMVVLAKSSRLSAEPVYQQYCPMKKASWLSGNKAIKNPYYGSAMLTCGSIKETL